MWCDAMEVENADDTVITWDQFCEFYADVSMKFFEEKAFIDIVQKSWAINEQSHLSVNQKDLEHLCAAIRHSLLKSGSQRHTEEFVLRELFREFARDGDGAVTTTELRAMLNKININTEERFLEAFIKACDKNNCGSVEFEELRFLIIEGRYTRM